jgi:uncharacterized protein (DUF58 family)
VDQPESTARRIALKPLIVVIVSMAIVAIAVYFVLDAHPLSTASRFETLMEVCERKVQVRRAFAVATQNGTVLVVEYEVPAGGLQSGPPAAVFTSDGRRVAYSDDIGDDRTFTERWHKSDNMQDVADVCAWLQGG